MQTIDWIVLGVYFFVLLAIGRLAYKKVKGSGDFFVAGGKVPWWLSGISHHMDGYSGAVFVAYAAIAYNYGFSLWVWWALGVASGIIIGAFTVAPKWSRVRSSMGIESTTGYLLTRFNLPVQQLMGFSITFAKFFDVAGKWAALAILLNVFTGLPLTWGVPLAGVVSLAYVTIGGAWADIYNDFAQFIVLIVAGMFMFALTLAKLGGFSGLWTVWDRLPPGHGQLFNGPYTPSFFIVFIFIFFLSYSSWSAAARYLSTSSGSEARKAAILSGCLYLVWPLILFFPMWAAPIFLPHLKNPSHAYAVLALKFMPPGLFGLVVAALFSATLSMTSTDTNTISAIITKDILPASNRWFRNMDQKKGLLVGRIVTVLFTGVTLGIALEQSHFGGVLGLVVHWFLGLIGPISIPLIFGLLPIFRRSGPTAAIVSIIGGFAAFFVVRYGFNASQTANAGAPVITSAVLFVLIGLLSPASSVSPRVDQLHRALRGEEKSSDDAPVSGLGQEQNRNPAPTNESESSRIGA
jgi:Na+/proline symporter